MFIQMGITASDIETMLLMFEEHRLDPRTHAFRYNWDAEEWELYTVDLSAEIPVGKVTRLEAWCCDSRR